MQIIRVIALGIAGALGAGCGQATPPSSAVVDPTSTTTTTVASTTTSTTMAPTTTTTACQVTVTVGAAEADLNSLIGGRRIAESAVAQIQLVADNAGRKIDSAKRYVAGVQADYNEAKNVYSLLGTDNAKADFDRQARRLADAKDIVASWEAIRTKALGDLSRGKATLADWDKRIAAARRAVTAAKTTSC